MPLTEKAPFGVKIRSTLHIGESRYFDQNRHVTGMAADDDQVILNPYAKLKPEERKAVIANEAARIHMRKNNIRPQFDLTDEQRKRFQGTEYEGNEDALRETIAARIYSGDPSAGEPTDEQVDFVERELKGKRKTLMGK